MCHVQRRTEIRRAFRLVNLKERDHLEDLEVD
jgi:hypothetical protein